MQFAAVQAKPYLVALGSPPLRFQELAPPPDLVTRPPAAAPPQLAAASDVVAPASAPIDTNPAAGPEPTTVTTVTNADPSPAATAEQPAAAPLRAPPPIIPDEMRPQARPEDFLPFFQIPVSEPGDTSLIVPVPRAPATAAPLPPSSATYTQTPR